MGPTVLLEKKKTKAFLLNCFPLVRISVLVGLHNFHYGGREEDYQENRILTDILTICLVLLLKCVGDLILLAIWV